MFVSILLVLVIMISSSSLAFRSNDIIRSNRLSFSICNKMGLKESKLSMFSNGGSTPPSVVTDKKDTIEEKVEKVEDDAKNDDIFTNVAFRVQDLLTLGLIGWTVYLVGDSIRIVAFSPPQI